METAVRRGHEVEEIVRMAKEGGFRLLILGYHGHGGIVGGIMGVTAQSIARLAPCSWPNRRAHALPARPRASGRIRSRKGGLSPVERLLLIALGGALGTALRYLTSILAARWFGAEFPYGTLIVNLSGAFVIGVVQQIGTQTVLIPDNVRLFLTTGMMGGLTTYSAFSYETVQLMELGSWHQAWINVVVTTTICLSLCFLGIATGRLLLTLRG